MTSIDQDPRKRRKLTLNNKTPTQLKGSLRLGVKQCTPRSAHIPIPKKRVKILRSTCQNVESSDESSLEIGWDNNSPSPSTCAKPGRRKGKKNDISAILKKVPKKVSLTSLPKKCDPKEGQSNVVLKTWMQDDLAVCTYSPEKPIKISNRKFRNRSQRNGAKTFNEELKSFIEKVVQSGERSSVPIGSTPQRRSAHIPSESKHSESQNSLNISPIDPSLCNSPLSAPLYTTQVNPGLIAEQFHNVGTSPVNPDLIADQFDNVNWSYIDTPAIKKTYETNTIAVDNATAKKASCKTLYEKYVDNVDATSKLASRKTLYATADVTDNTTACKVIDVGDSLMNIDFDDDLDECTPTSCGDIPDTIPVSIESVLLTELLIDCPSITVADQPVHKIVTCNTKTNSGDISLMNINFDDDLADILLSQPLDTQTKEKESKDIIKCIGANFVDGDMLTTECPCPSKITDDKDFPRVDVGNANMSIDDLLMDDKDVSMLFDEPLLEGNDIGTLPNDNFTNALCTLDNNDNNNQRNSALIANTMCTPNRKKSTVDLIGFDDADDLFDDIIVSLDGAVKCKSQETPPQSITADQRRMKNRCHTSPFPLTSKKTLLTKESKTIIKENINSNDTDKKCTVNNLLSGVHRNTKGEKFNQGDYKPTPTNSELYQKQLKSETNILNKEDGPSANPCRTKKNVYSFKSSVNVLKCRNNSISNTLPIVDISIIGGKNENPMCEDVGTCIPNSDANNDLFTSTQKYSLNDIQRKREEAQSKLKQRNRWKK